MKPRRIPSEYESPIVSRPILIVTGHARLIRPITESVGLWKGTPKSRCAACHM